MEAVVTCQLCYQRYDLTLRRPKTLLCGHCFCLQCLESWSKNSGKLQCPYDNRRFPGKAADLPDSQAVKDLLLSLEVRCYVHPGEVVDHFCLLHIQPICPKCPHQPTGTCNTLSITEDQQEIMSVVSAEIQNKASGLTLSKLLELAVSRRFKETLNANLAVLEQLRTLERQLTGLDCAVCTKGPPNYLDVTTYLAYCSGCHTVEGSFMEISDLLPEDLHELLLNLVRNDLKKVSFVTVNHEFLQKCADLHSAKPRTLQELGQALLKLELMDYFDFESLPAVLICPGCGGEQQKSSCNMRVLTCSQLHALCEKCVFERREVRCPLDNLESSPVSSQPLKPCAVHIKDSDLPINEQPCSPMPVWTDETISEVTRFSSVLPLQHSSSPGWLVRVSSRQTEAVTLICSGTCELVGLGVGNPVVAGQTAVLDSVQLYMGQKNVGAPYAWHVGHERLVGSDIVTHVFFHHSVTLPANTRVTLQIRITSDYPTLEVYRGSPVQRPKLHTGSDGLHWVFQEAIGKEWTGGSNAYSGPILRLLYRRIK